MEEISKALQELEQQEEQASSIIEKLLEHAPHSINSLEELEKYLKFLSRIRVERTTYGVPGFYKHSSKYIVFEDREG